MHFSVAFLVVGGLCEAWGILSGRGRLEGFGAMLVAVGTASLIPTVATGFLAENSVTLPDGADSILERHESVGLVVLAVFLVSQLWKAWLRGRIPPSQRRVYAVLLLAMVALVGYGALLGGEMVYLRGVGVLERR